jgi:hypothetical protein
MKQVIKAILNEELSRPNRRGKAYAWRKKDFIDIISHRTGKKPKSGEFEKAIEEISKEEPYQFLIKSPLGYYFPKNEREWNTYLKARRKLALGFTDESIRLSGLNYKKF